MEESKEIKRREIKPDIQFSKKIESIAGETLNLCFQCGRCTSICPSGKLTALRTRKTVRRAQLGLKEVLNSEELWLCTTCYTCVEKCPRGVEIVDVIMSLRNLAVLEGKISEAHKKVLIQILNTGHMIPFSDADRQKREKLSLQGVPPTVLSDEKSLNDVKILLKNICVDKLLGGK
ncbi:MAG: CoB--CoM heterodisulfide reductase subunit C [Thermoplasmata archaeon]